ncbi:beta-ketoacyl synthase N-terminal-like domain-containing protein, partial [Streptomyces sp. NPDC001274]
MPGAGRAGRPGHVSYKFGFLGPSISIYTACST